MFRIVLALVLALVVAGIFIPAGPFGTLEVWIDCGDRRQRIWFVGWPEGGVPGREHLVKLGAEIGVPSEWHEPPFRAPSNTDQGRYMQYSRIAWWAEHEPGMAKIMLREFADYYQNPPREPGYPPSSQFLFLLETDSTGNRYQLSDLRESGWTEEQLLVALREIEYMPEPGGPLDEAITELTRRDESP
jgi:hypothetical protein